MARDQITRRDFLSIGLTALGGLAIGVRLDRRPTRSEEARAFAPNAFARVEPGGEVVVVVPRPEMGQGSRSAIAMLVAEEVEADWEHIRIEQTDLDEAVAVRPPVLF